MTTVKKLIPADRAIRIVSVSSPETLPQQDYKLCFPGAEGFHILGWRDILYCRAENNYCRIYLGNGKQIFLAKTLRSVEKYLPAHAFARIHRSHLVRMETIIRVHPWQIEIQDGSLLPVSRDRYRELISSLEKITVMVR